MPQNNALCEIRIPTYNAPELLQRALLSLISQSHTNWAAIIFDDSTDAKSEEIVAHLKDSRIVYRRNPCRLGAAKNINQAFRKEPYLSGHYFCVLEDDNWLLPLCLVRNVSELSGSSSALLLRNQRIWNAEQSCFQGAVLDNRFTEGTLSSAELGVELLMTIGISNGGLFWSRAAESDLEVTSEDVDAVFQEYLRAAQIYEDILVALDPLSVFRSDEHNSRRGNVGEGLNAFIRSARRLQRLRQSVWSGLEGSGCLREAVRSEKLLAPMVFREEAVLRIGRQWPFRSNLRFSRKATLMAKAIALHGVSNVMGF
jgi:glycosyltransferase involved in cell wall biosynthesis